MRHTPIVVVLACGVAGLGPGLPRVAHAFPPYRSTDAETADPWTLEGRLGLLRLRRDGSENVFITPLWRVNLGLPFRLELITEGEWNATAGRLGDAAVGMKWVPFFSTLSVGVEALALLPISSAGGTGTEVQVIATHRWEAVHLHLNGGGFYDARSAEVEKGWRGSLLAEAPLGRWRPGLELFAKQVNGGAVEPLGGAGVIVKLGPVDLRTGVHVGLAAASPDVTANFWIASKLPLR
jgi:hypothetical protein